MRRLLLGAAAIAGGLITSNAQAATQLADGGFETVAGSVGSFCYGPACPAGAWTTADGAGFQQEGNGAWPGADTPDGQKYAFIQNLGYVEQTFEAQDSGLYRLTWLEAGRPHPVFTGNLSYDVLLNDLVLGSFSTQTFQPFTAENTGSFNLLAGQSYTVRFQGKGPLPDNTGYFDAIQLAAVDPGGVPEPATWAMMILGFGAAGSVVRRRRGMALA